MTLLLLSLLAGLATFLGAVLALFLPGEASHHGLMSFSGGVMLVLAAADLLPAAWAQQGAFVALAGTAVGVGLLSLAAALPRAARTHPMLHTGRLTALAIALHDLPEGIALAAGLVSAPLGFSLAIAIGLHNLPEGAATAAPLRAAGVAGWRILLLTLTIGLITPLGTLIGLFWLRVQPDSLGWLLSLAAGAMIAVGWQQLRHSRSTDSPRRLAWFAAGALLTLALALGLH